jgi:hypothetical protein
LKIFAAQWLGESPAIFAVRPGAQNLVYRYTATELVFRRTTYRSRDGRKVQNKKKLPGMFKQNARWYIEKSSVARFEIASRTSEKISNFLFLNKRQ